MDERLQPDVNQNPSDEEAIYDSEEDEMLGGDHHWNDRPNIAEGAAEGGVVSDSEEELPNHHDQHRGVEENGADEGLIFDSGESNGEDEENIYDSDEEVGLLSDGDDEVPINYNRFEDFFYVNVEGRGLDESLQARGNMRKFEKLLLEIAKALRFKHTYVSMLASFKIANLEFNNASFPIDMKVFWKLVNRNLENFQRSIVCTVCWEDLGIRKEPDRVCRCGETGPGKTKHLGTFLYLNLAAQLQALLSKTGMARALGYPWTRIKRDPHAIEDVYDGSVYRQLSAEGEFLCRGNHNYSLAVWTDGVDPVVSTPVTIWPVFVQVLELSPRARQRNSLLAALYVGPRKPQMAKFLIPFATELRNLYLDGITWRPNGTAEVTSRFITLIVAADSAARYEIMGMMRHNAYFGCTFCYAQGERIGERNEFHIYRYRDGNIDNNEEFAADRTDAEIRRDAELASANDQPVNGVRVHSAMSISPGTDLRKSQLVEALHLWERLMLRLYTITTNPDIPNHITEANLRIISSLIELAKPPTKLARRPRPLEHFAKYKATEYRNLAWYYWLPCAHDYMTDEQIAHFSLFADSMYVLNKDSIRREELEHVARNLDLFREQSENMFPDRYLTYSLHLLKHAVRCVQELGPLWVASGFWFESLNRQVKNYITSPTDRAMQIACRILLAQMVEKCLDWPLSPAVLNLLREFLHKAKWVVPPANATGRFIRHARGVAGLLNQQELAVLAAAGYHEIDERRPVTRHEKISIDGVMYQPHNEKPVKYDNSVVHITSNDAGGSTHFIRIMSIIKWRRGAEEMEGVIGRRFLTIGAAFNTSYMKIVQETEDLVYLPVGCINSPVVLVESLGTTYVSPIPNRWDVD